MTIITPAGEKVSVTFWVTNSLIQGNTKGLANYYVRTSTGINKGFYSEHEARKYFKKLINEFKGEC